MFIYSYKISAESHKKFIRCIELMHLVIALSKVNPLFSSVPALSKNDIIVTISIRKCFTCIYIYMKKLNILQYSILS